MYCPEPAPVCLSCGRLFLQKTVETGQIERPQGKLAGQQPPEVTGDAVAWDGQEDKTQSDQQADNIHDKDVTCQTQSLQDAGWKIG